jgi:H+/gluconate symporter-like permease
MLPGLVLVAVIVLAAVSSRTGVAGVVALAVVSLLWLRVNGSMEGPVLWKVSRGHGLTLTDLAGIAGLGVATWRGAQALRRRRRIDERV